MKMENIQLLLSIVLFVLLFGCTEQSVDELKMGRDYIKDESGIVLIDTLSLELGTIRVDSINTSNISSLMVGSYTFNEDTVNSQPVFRFKIPERSNFDKKDIFDSITICMDYSKYSIGDTINDKKIDVVRIDTDLDKEYADSKGFYMGNKVWSNIKTLESIGYFKYLPRPNKGKQLEKRLDDSFGQVLFEKFKDDDDDDVKSSEKFQDFFKGVTLKSNDNSVLGFAVNDTSLCLKMYYHRVKSEKEELVARMKMGEKKYAFNNIKVGGEIYDKLDSQKKVILSKNNNHKTFIQGSSGLMTRVRFPGVEKLLQFVELDQIIKAELILVPTKESEKVNDLPESLIAYKANSANILKSLYAVNGDAVSMYLHKATDNFESYSYYSLDVTSYITSILLSGEFDSKENALIISASGELMQSSFTTLMLGGESNPILEYRPKLKIYTYYY